MATNAMMEEFEALLNESFEIDTPQEGSVVKGKVIAVEAGQAIIDVGYKMEGRIDLKEFANPGEAPEIAVGDEVEVYLRNVENARGEAVLSREMARREAAWDRLEKAYAAEERVEDLVNVPAITLPAQSSASITSVRPAYLTPAACVANVTPSITGRFGNPPAGASGDTDSILAMSGVPDVCRAISRSRGRRRATLQGRCLRCAQPWPQPPFLPILRE